MWKQVICDLVASKDGSLFGNRRTSAADPQFVEVITCCSDMQYAVPPSNPIARPRIGNGMLLLALNTVFEKLNGYKIKFTQYGKPHPLQYEFIESRYPHKKSYMIGDNLQTDIQGANLRKASDSSKEWVSILVQTGVHQGHEMENIKADYVVKDF